MTSKFKLCVLMALFTSHVSYDAMHFSFTLLNNYEKEAKVQIEIPLLSEAVQCGYITQAFYIPDNKPDCFDTIDNDPLLTPSENCSWLLKAKKDVAKYRNFFADLVQGENKDYALELQEIFNLLSQARDEKDEVEKENMLKYAKWLMNSTKNLDAFLLKKGIWRV